MKKMAMIIVPIILAAGGVFGAAKMGMVQIPGISPKKASAAGLYEADKDATAMYEADKNDAVAQKDETKTTPPVTPPTTNTDTSKPAEPDYEVDPVQGRKKLAKLWNTLDVAKLVEITADWKDEDLATQLAVMDPEKVGQLLAALDPKKASKISKLIQEEASKVYVQG